MSVATAEETAARVPKAYRFTPATVKKIEELTGRLKRSATNVLELAVEKLYEAEVPEPEEVT